METSSLTFLQVKELDLGHGEKPDYFNTKAFVTFSKKDSCLYKACPNQDCNKKVTEGSGGAEFFCEKCNQNFTNFKYRMILTVSGCNLYDSIPSSATPLENPRYAPAWGGGGGSFLLILVLGSMGVHYLAWMISY